MRGMRWQRQKNDAILPGKIDGPEVLCVALMSIQHSEHLPFLTRFYMVDEMLQPGDEDFRVHPATVIAHDK